MEKRYEEKVKLAWEIRIISPKLTNYCYLNSFEQCKSGQCKKKKKSPTITFSCSPENVMTEVSWVGKTTNANESLFKGLRGLRISNLKVRLSRKACQQNRNSLNKMWSRICVLHKISQTKIRTHPPQNGQTEKVNQTALDTLGYCQQSKDVSENNIKISGKLGWYA